MPRHWLMKSEPDVYSIDDLRRDRRTSWEGVRNYQARNHMRDMARGDVVLFYHSNAAPPGVAGVAKILRTAYPDHFAWDESSVYFDPKSTEAAPRWWMVDVGFVKKLARLVPLDELKSRAGLENMVVTKRSRLSVQPVTEQEFEIVVALGGRSGDR